MKDIGGYFELEINKGRRVYHDGAIPFKSGRSSFQYILEQTSPLKVYLPFYSCDSLIEPLVNTGTRYEFYAIDSRLEPLDIPVLDHNEYFLYINYFDLKRDFTEQLSTQLGDKLIVDNTQAFFQKGNGRSWYFNSCRKFFGTPDGSYLYLPGAFFTTDRLTANENIVVEHLVARFNGKAEAGYPAFLENEKHCGGEVRGMSKLSEYLLSQVDYDEVQEKRKENFHYLCEALEEDYLFAGEKPAPDAVPMAVPVLMKRKIDRTALYDNHIYVPRFWQDVLEREETGYEMERSLSENLLPLPIDHRYNISDMQVIEAAIIHLR